MKVAIIGAGGIANEHKRGYTRLEGVELAAVVDPSPAARERAEKEWNAKAFETVAEMLDAVKPDAVSVCSPPKFHKAAVIECLKRGVAVLCEKPMAMNLADAEEMAAVAASTGTPMMIAFCHRFQPVVMQVKEAIDAGKLGKVKMFRNRFGGRQDMSKKWFGDPEIAGGGCMMDTSIHSIDLFRFLVGPATWVTGAVADIAGFYKLEDSGIITLGTADGAFGVIEGSWSTPASANIIEVYGTEGAAVVDYNTGEAKLLPAGAGEWVQLTSEGPDRFEREVEAFVNAVKTKTPTPITAQDGLAANKVVDATYKSSKDGVRVSL